MFNSPTAEWIGFALLLVAVVLAVSATVPGRHELPMSRRRPDVAPPPGVLAKVGTAASQSAGHLLSGRGSDLQEALTLAGIRSEARDVVVLIGSVTLTVFAAGLLLLNAIFGVLLAVLVPVGFWVFLRVRASRRRTRFSDQLSEVLQILASGLRAGSSLPQAPTPRRTERSSPRAATTCACACSRCWRHIPRSG